MYVLVSSLNEHKKLHNLTIQPFNKIYRLENVYNNFYRQNKQTT